MNKYSVIIITYNEESSIQTSIDSIKNAFNEVEIIVVDGSSTDNTIAIVKQNNTIACSSKPCRGVQLNKGANLASGNILIFMHGDTKLPSSTENLLSNFFNNPENKIASFRLGFDSPNILLKFYCLFTRFDSFFTKFGDQTIIIRKDFYNKLNGFKNWQLFEDVDFLKRARKLSKIKVLPASVITSSRRFKQDGIIKHQFKSAWLILQYLFGVKPEVLAEKYDSLRSKKKEKFYKISKTKNLAIRFFFNFFSIII